MSVLKTAPYHRAVGRVSRWCRWYTRDLDAVAADERRDELASDLYEHAIWADESGVPPRTVARAIVVRALRGAPADLVWRHSQRTNLALADPVGFRRLRVNRAVSALIVTVAAGVLGWGMFVLTRIALSVLGGDIRPGSETAWGVLAFTASAVAALLLMSRRRSRAVGALLMIAPSFGLVYLGLYQLYSISATVGALTFSMPGWNMARNSMIAGLTFFFIAAAVWWWPDQRTLPADRGTRLRTIGEMAR